MLRVKNRLFPMYVYVYMIVTVTTTMTVTIIVTVTVLMTGPSAACQEQTLPDI